MIGKLTGTLDITSPGSAVIIEAGGVGYSVHMPLAAREEMRTHKQKEISLYIHTVVREDAIDLYGFRTLDELSFFKELMGVKSVGPKTALGILNVADVQTLRRAIARGDAGALTKVFGIGKKTAERVVVELRDKLARDAGASGGAGMGDDAEVIEALIALGYSAQEGRRAVQAVAAETSGVHNRLAEALRHLGAKKV
jgi:Holliday junction DNA helicase RuvA